MNASDFLIVGDDGHGLRNPQNTAENPGKRTPLYSDGHYVLEDQFNKATCNFFLEACARCYFKTLALAPEDYNVLLSTRTQRANNAHADASVSWHFNAITGTWQTSAHGQNVFYQSGRTDSQKLATLVHKYLIQGTIQMDRGVKPDDLAMCRDIHTGPAILIENGFMDYLPEANLMLDENFQREQAEQACMGICEYFGVPYIVPNQNGDDIVKGMIIAFGDADWDAAKEAHYITGFPITSLTAFNDDPVNAQVRVHVGGPDQPNTPTDIYCGGIDRIHTVADVLKEFHII